MLLEVKRFARAAGYKIIFNKKIYPKTGGLPIATNERGVS